MCRTTLSNTPSCQDSRSSRTGSTRRNMVLSSRGGSMTMTTIAQRRPDHVQSRAAAIKRTRVLLCLSLMVLAVVLGVCVNLFFSAPEETLAIEQFESIAGRATSYAQQTTQLKRLGVITMATMIGTSLPNAEAWPFVFLEGYDEIASRLVQTISGDGIGFAPIVDPKELLEFEAFAYDAYYNELNYPNTTAVSSFGRGVWANDGQGRFNVEAEDRKYHEGAVHPNGETTYGSPYSIYTPVLQHADGYKATPLMLNLHNEKIRGQTIDSIITCSLSHTAPNSTNENVGIEKRKECGQMTDLLLLTQRRKPAGLIMQPIFPARNLSTIVGIVSSPLIWGDVLINAFGREVNGIHCVLTCTSGITYTYKVVGGNATFIGEGDRHDKRFDIHEEMVVLTDEESGLYSEFSAGYTLKLYPTEEFMKTYKTNNPLWGAIISVCIVSFTSIVFFIYDSNVRGEFTFKNELLEAKRNFIRFVSHEVRTPLNAVCMGLMLMRQEFEKARNDFEKDSDGDKNEPPHICQDIISEWQGVTDDILGNAQSAVDVLNDLLNYDKITTGSLQLELSLLDVDYLMSHAQKEFKLPAAKKQIDVVFEDKSSPSYKNKNFCIVGDEVRLIQVLRNLMSNALKFTPQGGNVKVKFSWVQHLSETKKEQRDRRKGQHTGLRNEEKFTLKKGDKVSLTSSGFLRITVADTGAGMTEEQLSNVFEQGTQFNVNELQRGQGSGLGLYIAKGIMDQHHGTLSVSSEGLGKGTEFTMSIPVYHDNTRNSEEEAEDSFSEHFEFKAKKSSGRPHQSCSNLRILVVDDSDTNRKFLTRILQNHGHTCDQARNGSEAVDKILETMVDNRCSDDGTNHDENHYDAVLLDYEMPVMNGPTAAKQMRVLGSDAFIVGITGNLLPEDIEHFKDQGANEVLPKPFNISDLEEILMEYGVGFRGKYT